MGRLYIIPNRNDIEASLAIAERYDAKFEYNDFCLPDVLDDDARLAELIAFYKSLPRDRSKDTLHGAFFDVTVHSDDKLIRHVSDLRIRQSMEIACKLGVGGVIFHTNLIPNFKDAFYVDGWVTRNAAYWRALAAEYPQISIYVENMFDSTPDAIARLMQELGDVPNVGVCLDFAHAAVFGENMQAWLDMLLPYAAHLHVNDNDGVCDRHMAIGDGVLDYAPLDRAIKAQGRTPGVLIETKQALDQIQSIEYLRDKGFYPFREGGEAYA